jgi:very-short-patch-repair endonuclease
MSDAEERFLQQVRALGLRVPLPEYSFHPTRRWRFDFAWPFVKLAVEIEGGVYAQGRHTRGAGFEADCVKYAEAVLLGWRVLRFTTRQVESGMAIEYVEQILREGAL